MIITNFIKDGNPEKKVLFVQNQNNPSEEASLVLPTFDAKAIEATLEHIGPNTWKSEADGAEGVTHLLMMFPDDNYWSRIRKLIIDFSLVGEKPLANLMPEILEDIDVYSIEEYALAYWVEEVRKVLFSLKEQETPLDKILSDKNLLEFFN